MRRFRVPKAAISSLILLSMVCGTPSFFALLQTPNRDGQHDFDPLAGTWKAHTKYRAHPFVGSDTWIESDGTETFQKLWDGAMLELSEGATANGPVGLMLYTYSPESQQWYVYFASRKDGKIGLPNVGEFRN